MGRGSVQHISGGFSHKPQALEHHAIRLGPPRAMIEALGCHVLTLVHGTSHGSTGITGRQGDCYPHAKPGLELLPEPDQTPGGTSPTYEDRNLTIFQSGPRGP